MTPRRKFAFALIAMALSGLLMLSVLLVADIRVHAKFQESGGLNVWGYRGPTVGRKRANEQRVVVVGGSTAFGYGVRWHEAFPAQLETLLKQPRAGVPPPFPVSVVNLAYNNEGAHSIRYTLADYDYLNYDLALLYVGDNDIGFFNNYQASNRQVYRHDSLLFRLTGYFPMLPVVLREKAMAIRYNGRLEDAYRGTSTVFRPNIAQRSAASILETVAQISGSLDHSMGESRRDAADVKNGAVTLVDPESVACAQFTGFCDEVYQAIQAVLNRGKRALVVTQPPLVEVHGEQQRLLVDYVSRRFAGNARVQVMDLGPSVNLHDPLLSLEGSHLTAAGNAALARSMADGVLAALTATTDARRVEPTPVSAASPAAPAVRAVVARAPGTIQISPRDKRPMAWIPAGAFQMGSPESEAGRGPDEVAHPVTIADGFWMDTTTVTNDEFLRFVTERPEWSFSSLSDHTSRGGVYLRSWGADHRPPPGKGDLPVTAVVWIAARGYCAWAGKRLPAEAEWEYAARAGTVTPYWWGTTPEVEKFRGRANPWGLVDMVGRLWEWTSSLYRPYPYRADDGREAFDLVSEEFLYSGAPRVLRGGAALVGPNRQRSADRFKYRPHIASDYVGFRCVQSGS